MVCGTRKFCAKVGNFGEMAGNCVKKAEEIWQFCLKQKKNQMVFIPIDTKSSKR